MKIVWEVANIVRTLTNEIVKGNTKGINLESPAFGSM